MLQEVEHQEVFIRGVQHTYGFLYKNIAFLAAACEGARFLNTWFGSIAYLLLLLSPVEEWKAAGCSHLTIPEFNSRIENMLQCTRTNS
jgi:hypothetical protein